MKEVVLPGIYFKCVNLLTQGNDRETARDYGGDIHAA
jgi:hypothetical protein